MMKLVRRWLFASGAIALVSACGARGDLDSLDDVYGATEGAGAGLSTSNGTGSSTQGAGGASTGSSGTGATGPGSGTSGPGSSSQTGPGSGTSTATSSATGGKICPSFGDPCTGCMSMACPDTFCNCAENQECLDLFGCLTNCAGDEACNQACLAAHEDGVAEMFLLSDCAGSTCDPSCGWGSDLEPCAECLLDLCDAAMSTCLINPECFDLFNCLTGCPQLDLTCQQGCYDQYSGGVGDLQELLQCSAAECQPICNP